VPDAASAASDILGVRVDRLSRRDALARASAFLDDSRCRHVVTANALLLLDAERNPELKRACADADLVVADSVGLVWAARAHRQSAVVRYPGIDFARDLCSAAARAGKSVFLLGAREGVAAAAAEFLQRSVPGLKLAGKHDGFFDENEESVAREIAASGASVVLVALGMPKQELWIYRWKNRLPGGVAVGVGGSFDVWAGRVPRAPRWMQTSGLEWLFRAAWEPSRWGRIARLPGFVWKVLRAPR
ncbi:MAG: WecB/TagA/CpsF family glycosyltransferase, partial [Elusimicrobia bacterium]|nr:WecB/TagA/CpsF family glycosyltransferase [Elusimicrobiota bacterium]